MGCQITFVCETGYNAQGPTSYACQADGTYEHVSLHCSPGNLINLDNDCVRFELIIV